MSQLRLVMRRLRFVSAVLAASTVFLLGSVATAGAPFQPTCGSGDCGHGFACTQVMVSNGAAEPSVEFGCTPAPCGTDFACDSDMVCHAWPQPCPDCECPPETPDCECAAPACEPTSVSICTPRYLVPCTTASDCGDGFTCEEQNGARKCVVQPVTCATAAECPEGWACQLDDMSMPPPGWCRPRYYDVSSSSDLAKPIYTSPEPFVPPSYESGTCQMGRPQESSGALSLLVVLGAVLGWKRRRNQP
jgi:hypothetical protein